MAKRKPALTRVGKLLRSDGALCVTFVNTARRKPIESYEDLLAWGLEFRALGSESAQRLAAVAAEHPGAAVKAFRRARTVLGRTKRMLLALAEGRNPATTDLKLFNVELRKAMGARELDPAGRRWCWGETEEEDLDRMLWPVLFSTAHLLTSKNRARVRRCGLEDCGLLFVARSSGRPRKWCGPACGNRQSSRKHYQTTIRPRRERNKKERHGEQRTRLAGYDDED